MNEEIKKKNREGNAMLHILKRKDWIILAAIVLAFCALVVALTSVKLTTVIEVTGIFAPWDKLYYQNQPYSGYITDILAENSENVKKGEVIARIYLCSEDTSGIPLDVMRENSVDICSEVDGYVDEIMVDMWQYVSVPTCIMRVRVFEDEYKHHAAAIVGSENSGKVHVGETIVTVAPSVMPKGAEGVIQGVVEECNILDADVKTYLDEKNLTEIVLKDKRPPYYMVYIKLDTNTGSGVPVFSNGYEYNEISPMDECTVNILVEEDTLYNIIFNREK